MNEVDCDVAVMRAAPGWQLRRPRACWCRWAARGDEHELRARVLSSICRDATREVTFVTVLPASTSDAAAAEAERELAATAEVKVGRGARPHVEVLRDDDAVGALLRACANHDLVVLGLQRGGWGRRVLGHVATAHRARGAVCGDPAEPAAVAAGGRRLPPASRRGAVGAVAVAARSAR